MLKTHALAYGLKTPINSHLCKNRKIGNSQMSPWDHTNTHTPTLASTITLMRTIVIREDRDYP